MTKLVSREALSSEEVELLKSTVCKGATDKEFELAVQVCNQMRLNPFAKQIYFVKRGNQMTPQISIDGARLVAERSGKYRGQTEPEWCGEDSKWINVWLSSKPPLAARCGVYRSDCDHPIYAVATLKSYGAQTPFWKKMPEVMLHKCAESLALRKAFPNELSGVYTSEEMQQAGPDPSALVGFSIDVAAAKTSAELKNIKPPDGLSKKLLDEARKIYKGRLESLLEEESLNQSIDPQTGEIIEDDLI